MIIASNHFTFLMYATSDTCSSGTKGLASYEHLKPNVLTGAKSPMCVMVHIVHAVTGTPQTGTATCNKPKVCTAVWKSGLLHATI